jgi:hypothetical protein
MGAGERAEDAFVEAEGAGGRFVAAPAPPAVILDNSEAIFVRPFKKSMCDMLLPNFSIAKCNKRSSVYWESAGVFKT